MWQKNPKIEDIEKLCFTKEFSQAGLLQGLQTQEQLRNAKV